MKMDKGYVCMESRAPNNFSEGEGNAQKKKCD